MLRWIFIFLFCFLPLAFSSVDFILKLNHFSPKESYLNPKNFLNLETRSVAKTGIFWQEQVKFFDEKVSIKFSDLLWIFPSSEKTTLTNRINELYLSFMPFDWLMITVGKEVIGGGVGYFRNPTDYLLDKKVLDEEERNFFRKYAEGRLLLDTQFFVENYSIQLVFVPKIVWDKQWIEDYLSLSQEKPEFLIKFQGNLYGVDFIPIVYYGDVLHTGLNLVYVFGENLEIHFEGSYSSKLTQKLLKVEDIYFGSFKVGETNALFEREISWVPTFLIGGHYTFQDQKVTLMIEYLYNGKGLNREEWFNTLDIIESTAQNFSSTNVFSLASLQTEKMFLDFYTFTHFVNHYLMIRFYKEFDELVSWELVNLNNLVDLSGYVKNTVYFDFDSGRLEFELGFPYGEKKSEFGLFIDTFSINLTFVLFM